jgi:hypothetical protein
MHINVLSHGGIAIISLDDGRKCVMSVDYKKCPDGHWDVSVLASSFRWHEATGPRNADQDLALEVARFLAAEIVAQGGNKIVRIEGLR